MNIKWYLGIGIRPDGSIDEINCVTGRTVHHAPPGTFPRWQMPKIPRCDHEPAVHFIGFRGDEYNNAVKVWGKPDYIVMGWDRRARRDVCELCDTVVFARGEHDQEPSPYTFNDLMPTPEEIEERKSRRP